MTGAPTASSGTRPTVLVVDDDPVFLRATVRLLEGAGFSVTPASTAAEALEALERCMPDVVVADVGLSDMEGTELLARVRSRDPDLPVVLVTGQPSVRTAALAVEHGELRYIVKPLAPDDLVEAITKAAKLRRIVLLGRKAATVDPAAAGLVCKEADLEASLIRGVDTLWMAYQPIVDPRARLVVGYEALIRSREPSLPSPGHFFAAAERLERVHDVGRAVRRSVARTLSNQHVQQDIFVNLHSKDLLDDTLYSPGGPLAAFAEKVVLEITERAALASGVDIPARVDRLRRLGYRVAIDDLGAGYEGLSYFALVMPQVVKLDLSLVRGVDGHEIKRRLVGSLTELCRELCITVVAEGVETAPERDALVDLGCDLLQGYLFARPAPPFPHVKW